MKEIAKQAQSAPSRTLKIEEGGDRYKGGIKPKIRLIGNWLRRAGFNPGGRVTVSFLGEGVITLTTYEKLGDGCLQIPLLSDTGFSPDSKGIPEVESVCMNHLICEQGGSQ